MLRKLFLFLILLPMSPLFGVSTVLIPLDKNQDLHAWEKAKCTEKNGEVFIELSSKEWKDNDVEILFSLDTAMIPTKQYQGVVLPTDNIDFISFKDRTGPNDSIDRNTYRLTDKRKNSYCSWKIFEIKKSEEAITEFSLSLTCQDLATSGAPIYKGFKIPQENPITCKKELSP